MKILFSVGLYLAYLILTLIIFYFNGTCIWDNFPDKLILLRIVFIPAFLSAITWLNVWLFSKKVLKENRKMILIGLITLILLGFITGSIDYHQIINNNKPIFAIAKINEKEPEITYYGLNYKIIRRPIFSYKDDLRHDVYVKFGFWFYTWIVDRQKT